MLRSLAFIYRITRGQDALGRGTHWRVLNREATCALNFRKMIHFLFNSLLKGEYFLVYTIKEIFWQVPNSRWQRWAIIHFSQRQDPDLQNESIVERWWVASQGPVHLRPTFHDCGQTSRCSKGQRLVTCFLLGFRTDSGNSYLLSEIILFFFF